MKDGFVFLRSCTMSHTLCTALVGRYANRIKNGTFEINNQKYFTPINEHGVDTLHGGFTGTDRLNWTITDKGRDYIVFESWSPSGDQGFPGNLLTKVRCKLPFHTYKHVLY